jgi:hypothetical protein
MGAEPENKNYQRLLRRLNELRNKATTEEARRAYDRAIAEAEKAFLLPVFD